MADRREIELVIEPQESEGYHVNATELPGLHTQGDDMDDALANATRRSRSTSRDSAKTANCSTWAKISLCRYLTGLRKLLYRGRSVMRVDRLPIDSWWGPR